MNNNKIEKENEQSEFTNHEEEVCIRTRREHLGNTAVVARVIVIGRSVTHNDILIKRFTRNRRR